MFVEPMKQKCGESVVKAFTRIFERVKYLPWKIVSDQGKEFTCAVVQHHFKSLGIEHFALKTSPVFHAGIAERANRTIKDRLYRFFNHHNTRRWIDVIQDLIHAINGSWCSSIDMRPVDVTFENASTLLSKLKIQSNSESAHSDFNKPHFNVGDMVRIEKHKHSFEKGYTGNFTIEIFTVCHVRMSPKPITYRLADSNGEIIEGWFYKQDLSRVRIGGDLKYHGSPKKYPSHRVQHEEPAWAIENVIKEDKIKGIECSFVKWRGWASKYNSWIPSSSITER
jgi:hypothetical protein